MSLALAPLPPLLAPSPGRTRVQLAAELVQDAWRQLLAAEREEAAARERREREFSARAVDARRSAAMKRAETMAALYKSQVHVNAKWFFEFAHDAVDGMTAQMRAARENKQLAFANQLEKRIGELVDKLNEIHARHDKP